MPHALQGKVTDYGDLLHIEQWLVKGQRHSPVWHLGAESDTTAADRVARGLQTSSTGKVDLIMDLKADKKRTVALTAWTDELGNPTSAPADAVVVYSTDDPDGVLSLTDNGDGTGVVAAVGVLGSARLHAEITTGSRIITSDALVNVIAGDAERVEMEFGEEEEVTPDV